MFTMQNTDGFSQSQIKTLNAALTIVLNTHPGMDESNAGDLINDAWIGDEPAADLANRAMRNL